MAVYPAWTIGLSSLLLAACAAAPPFDPQAAQPSITPQIALERFDELRGRKVLWGGGVVRVDNLADRTELEVLAYPLDDSQRPQREAQALGRFVATWEGFLDPAVYRPGRALTVLGQVQEIRAITVGQARLQAPRVQAEGLHLWPKDDPRRGPRFYLGVGAAFN